MTKVAANRSDDSCDLGQILHQDAAVCTSSRPECYRDVPAHDSRQQIRLQIYQFYSLCQFLHCLAMPVAV